MSPTQIKLTLAGIGILIAWWFTPRAKPVPRVSKGLDVDVNVNSPYFGMTDSEIAAAKAASSRPNPALDPDMRRLIDVSNVLIDRDNTEQTEPPE